MLRCTLMRMLLAAALILMFGSAVRATNYYVSPNGSDTYNGLSQSTPFKEIQTALNAATSPGDTIYVMPGLHIPSVFYTSDSMKRLRFMASGTEGNPITLTTLPGASQKAIIDLRNVSPGYWGFTTNYHNYITVDGGGSPDILDPDSYLLEITNVPGFGTTTWCFNIREGHDIIVRNVAMTGAMQGCMELSPSGNCLLENIYARNADNSNSHVMYLTGGSNGLTVRHCNLSNGGKHGVQTNGAQPGNHVFERCYIHDNKGAPLNFMAGTNHIVRNCFLYSVNGFSENPELLRIYGESGPITVSVTNCTFYSNAPNGRPLLVYYYTGNTVDFRNCIFHTPSDPIIDAGNTVTADYNLFYGGIAQFGSNAFGGNPNFANPGTGNLHLTNGSVAIDAGSAAYAPANDIDGDGRPSGSADDLGADEGVGLTPSNNAAPAVDAGPNRVIELPANTVSLDGTVSDDGLPNPPGTVTVTWSKLSGPGSVTFGSVNAVDTTATFTVPGEYILELHATDGALSCTDTMSVLVKPAMPSGALINDDFQTDSGAWTSSAWSRVDLGGGDYVFSDGASGQAANTTLLPAGLQIDADLRVTNWTAPYGLSIYWQLSRTTSITYAKGYRLYWIDQFNTDNDGLRLEKRSADNGEITLLAFVRMPPNTNEHHVRICDDGLGRITVYWDNMDNPVIQLTDPAYIGGDNRYVGLYTYSTMNAWVDNFRVYGDAAPLAVTDLSATSADWFQINLAWTAPWDLPPGPASSYDLRCSTAPINDANFASATPIADAPLPSSPGYQQSIGVVGLNPNTTYYFALKSLDATGHTSAISNIASATTGAADTTAPAAVTNLGIDDVRPNRVTLSWTASGDDGSTGTATSYDIRYSTSEITANNWASATQATGEPVPSASGTTESFTVTGLSADTTYYFAIKVGDEVPNWSAISNVPSTKTLPSDSTAPNAITDLTVLNRHIKTATLRWTTPADSGGAGLGSYDVRYSTSTITAGNWNSAIQAVGEPVPAVPGVVQTFTVGGLSPSTTYYFAVKSADLAEPVNISAISNVTSCETLPPVPAVTIQNPWLVNDRVADCRTVNTMAATFDKAYTPDGVITPDASDIQTRAINAYNNFKRRCYHWGTMPPDNEDVVTQLNVFGWALCGSHAGMNARILYTMGLSPRTIAIANGGHTYYEVYYNGDWHALDTMTTFYVYDRGNPPELVSMEDVRLDKSLVLNAAAEGRACPGFLLCGDTPTYFANGADTWGVKATPGAHATDKSMDMTLRMGERLSRTCESWPDQFATGTEPYHHEAAHDWKDTVNMPYWEPYKLDSAGNAAIGISYGTTYRRWANGTVTLAPDFRSAGYQASLHSSTNIATFNDDGLPPDLHTAAVGTPSEAVFKITTPFYITDGYIEGSFLRSSQSDVNRISVSVNGTSWTPVWDNAAIGTTQLSGLSVRNQVYGYYVMYVRVELQSTNTPNDAGVSDLKITAVVEHNKGGMAYLDKGTNNITFTCDNPSALGNGATMKVVYKWKEYDGSGWNVDRISEQYITTSPASFTINVGGAKVPRTEYILMEVCPPPLPDESAPASVTDLAAPASDSTTVDLTWTATGDDGNVGTASTYDIRYSTSLITASNWASATQITGEPAPKVAGSTETFRVTGLTPSTTYYFAMKVLDEGNNTSGLSNVVSKTTAAPDLTPPATISNLAATAGSTTGSAVLTWTAPGDDGSLGTASTYDIRYSTSLITDGNWASATQCTGEPAPQPAGASESFTVTGLTLGTTYYFAMKVLDEAPNTSGLSNVASLTAKLGEKVLQEGLNGYTGCTDARIEAGNPTTNYGAAERMRVTGFGSTPSNIQRGLIKFDISSIPANTPITKATLWLYSYDAVSTKGSTGYYGAYAATRNWTETGVSWNNAASGTAWTTPGGDFNATPDGTAEKQASAGVWYAFDVTSRVQSWINGATNCGWIIKCTDELLNNQDSFYQLDTSNAAYRPKLVISDLTQDTTAPAAVSNLAASTGSGNASVVLTWTAPGDDGTVGTAAGYDIRYRTGGPVSDANWGSATQVTNEPTPQAAGSSETMTVTGLVPGTTYYFAIKTRDAANNVSAISNSPSAAASHLGEVTVACDKATYISLTEPTTNYGTSTSFKISGYGASETYRGLMYFNCSSIPPGTTITSAKIRFYTYEEHGGAYDYTVHELTRSNWTETGVTWNSYASGSAWTTAGGDYNATVAGRVTKPGTTANIWIEIDVTSAVQAWINNASTNCGVLIKVENESSNIANYCWSDDHSDPLIRPHLLITDAATIPSVAFQAATSNGSEATASVNLNVVLSAAAVDPVTVQYAITGGTATSGSDYTLTSGVLTFNPGVTSQPIPLTIVNDALDEDNETIIVTLSNPTNAILGGTVSHTYTINDDDDPPTVEFSSSGSSGSEATTSVDLPVVLNTASGKTVTVDYAVTGGTATSGSDYTLASGTLTFTPGQTSQTIALTIIDDTAVESDETVIVTLSNPSNATLNGGITYTYTIEDNETPTVQFSTTSSSGSESSTPASLTVVLDRSYSQPVTVAYSVTGGTATEGADYTLPTASASGTVALKRDAGLLQGGALDSRFSGLTSLDVVTTTVADACLWSATGASYSNYGTRTYTDGGSNGYYGIIRFDLSAYTGATINKAQLRFRCFSGNVTMKWAAIKSHAWSEGNKSGGLPGASPAAEGVCWMHPNGLYTTASGTGGWGVSSDSALDVTGNGADLYAWTNFTSSPSGNAWVVTDITSIVQDWVSGTKPNYGLLIDESNHSTYLSEIGTDYQPVLFLDYGSPSAVTEVTFQPGQTSRTIDLTIIDDSIVEPSETIQITLSNPTNAILGANTTHTYTILDNDNSAPTVDAGQDDSVTMPAAVTLDGTASDDGLPNPPGALTCTWSKVSGPGTVTFGNANAIDTTATFSEEGTYVLQLEAYDGALSATDTVTITVYSAPMVQFSAASSSGSEGSTPAQLTVTLNQSLGTTVTVDYAVTAGSALPGLDFAMASGFGTAGVKALKRDAGLTAGGAISSQFASLTGSDVVVTSVKDARLATAGNSRYMNYGTTTIVGSGSGSYAILGFDLAAYDNAVINKAELRLRASGGNGTQQYAAVKSHDWAEGNKGGNYPGKDPAAEGVCMAHPCGLYTVASGAAGWGANSDAMMSFTGDGADLYAWINFTSYPTGAAWQVADLTNLVQDWVNGTKPNYGLITNCATRSIYLSEQGTDDQPVLFLDYVLQRGTLTFAPGQISKTIDLVITDDATVEAGGETIVVTLSNPSGAVLGTNTTHTYTITDND